jgi:cation-transporting ATPase E
VGGEWHDHRGRIDAELQYPGLRSDEVRERVRAGLANNIRDTGSRSLASIVRSNTLTWFNALIGSLWAVILLVALRRTPCSVT